VPARRLWPPARWASAAVQVWPAQLGWAAAVAAAPGLAAAARRRAPATTPGRPALARGRATTVQPPPATIDTGTWRAKAPGFGGLLFFTASSTSSLGGGGLAPAELPEAAVDPQFGQLFLRAVLRQAPPQGREID